MSCVTLSQESKKDCLPVYVNQYFCFNFQESHFTELLLFLQSQRSFSKILDFHNVLGLFWITIKNPFRWATFVTKLQLTSS